MEIKNSDRSKSKFFSFYLFGSRDNIGNHIVLRQWTSFIILCEPTGLSWMSRENFLITELGTKASRSVLTSLGQFPL